MSHAFDLAFALLCEAADRIKRERYGHTHIVFHNYGALWLSTEHTYTLEAGHRLTLTAADTAGPLTTIEATTPDLHSEASTRILTVRAETLTFHATDRPWTYQASAANGTTITITAALSGPLWRLTVADDTATDYDDLNEAIDAALSAAA